VVSKKAVRELCDKLRNAFHRQRRIHLHELGHADDARGLATGDEECNPADARMTASVPTLVPASGRFSMKNCWPRRSDSHWPTSRAVTSFATTSRNGNDNSPRHTTGKDRALDCRHPWHRAAKREPCRGLMGNRQRQSKLSSTQVAEGVLVQIAKANRRARPRPRCDRQDGPA
jgi:hypothetical protein